MDLDFSKRQITLVVAPVDMRSGFARLSLMASSLLNIRVAEQKDVVVFISKSRKIVKLIWVDEHGSVLLNRRLNLGRFEKFLLKANTPATKEFTVKDLMQFLDGRPMMVERKYIL